MALVLFFVSDPAVGVAEMCRVVRSGGLVGAYHWDILEGGLPLADIGAEMRNSGFQPRLPPSVNASTLEASTLLWTGAEPRADSGQTCSSSPSRKCRSPSPPVVLHRPWSSARRPAARAAGGMSGCGQPTRWTRR